MQITVVVNDKKVIQKLESFPLRVQQSLMVAVTKLSIDVQRHVKENKLSGQVLHARTGTLRRSINRVITSMPNKISASIGTNVVYAAIHEYGYQGPVDVRAHVRRTKAQMQLARYRTRKDGSKVEILGSYRKAGGSGGETDVRAFVRQVNMPERSYLRSSLEDLRDRIKDDLREAVLGVLR